MRKMLDSAAMELIPRWRPRPSLARWLFCWFGCLVWLSGCQQLVGSDPETDRRQLETVLKAYLPRLAQAYATRDANLLAGLAVPKEVATVARFLGELGEQGRVIRPALQQVTIEDFKVWNHSNAIVTTLEVWDIRVYASGSDVLLSQALGQRNRVKYQLKRQDDSWTILLRQIERTFE